MINNKDFKRFFFYGIDNMEELKEGILYFASQELYAKKYSSYNIYEIPNKILIDEMLKIANKRYRHAIRFINLNDIDNDFEYDIDVNKSYLELKEKIQELLEENKIIESKAGVFFTREEEKKLQGGRYYQYGYGEDGWTKKVYDILSELDEMERTNNNQYYEYWIRTKLKRAEDRVEKLEKRTLQQEDLKGEVEKVKRAYEIFCDKKIKTKKGNKEIDRKLGE